MIEDWGSTTVLATLSIHLRNGRKPGEDSVKASQGYLLVIERGIAASTP